jgi:hypothetical protein
VEDKIKDFFGSAGKVSSAAKVLNVAATAAKSVSQSIDEAIMDELDAGLLCIWDMLHFHCLNIYITG